MRYSSSNFSNFYYAASEGPRVKHRLDRVIIALAAGNGRHQESLLPSPMALAGPESRGMSDKTACRASKSFGATSMLIRSRVWKAGGLQPSATLPVNLYIPSQ
jgi:hypothetical protein